MQRTYWGLENKRDLKQLLLETAESDPKRWGRLAATNDSWTGSYGHSKCFCRAPFHPWPGASSHVFSF